MKTSSEHSKFDELRRQAEELLRSGGGRVQSSEIDILSLIHELEVHQIELQIQNEELRSARVELEQSRNRYADLYQHAPMGYVDLTPGGLIAESNIAAKNILGLTARDQLKLAFSSLIHLADQRKFRALMSRLAKSGNAQGTCELRIVTRGGFRFIQLEMAPSTGEEKKLRGWRIAFVDITERKQMEEELRESKAKLKSELDMALLFHELSNQLVTAGQIQELYDKMLDTALAIMRSDFASIQVLREDETNHGKDWILHLIAWRGFHAQSAKFWNLVTLDSTSSCGTVLRKGERFLIADVEKSDLVAGTQDLEEYRRSGIRSVQSTPLISRSGRLLGMISTHWLHPYDPPVGDLNKLDVLARQVADLIEYKQAEKGLIANRDELELRVKERTAELESAIEKLGAIPSRLIAAQEKERKRLASELHDSVGQTLAAFKFRVEFILASLRSGKTEEAIRLTEEFVPVLQRSIEETRAIYMGLRPKILEDFGVIAALRWYREEILNLFPATHVEIEIGIDESEIPKDLVIPIFRIAQEAMTNASKHSRAEWIDLSLSKNGGRIDLVVSDDGVGMDVGQILQSSTSRSLGLTSMRERAELTGGEFIIESIPGEGTTVRVCWPIWV